MLLQEVLLFENDDLARSFASLVKYNNGKFKSDKQAKFLLSKCTDEDRSFTTSGTMWGNRYTMYYHCDEEGIHKVVKWTEKQGFKPVWDRKVEGKASIDETKAIKSLQRAIAKAERDIIERRESKDTDYADHQDLYVRSQKGDLDDLIRMKDELEEITSQLTDGSYKPRKNLLGDEEIASLHQEVTAATDAEKSAAIKKLEDELARAEEDVELAKTSPQLKDSLRPMIVQQAEKTVADLQRELEYQRNHG